MRIAASFLVAALVGVTAASGHSDHGHVQFHKRQHARAVTPRAIEVPNSPTAVTYVYELQGKTIDAQDCKEGLENGTLVLQPGEVNPFTLPSAQQAPAAPASSPAPLPPSIPPSSPAAPSIPVSPSPPVQPIASPLALSSSTATPPSYSSPAPPPSYSSPAPLPSYSSPAQPQSYSSPIPPPSYSSPTPPSSYSTPAPSSYGGSATSSYGAPAPSSYGAPAPSSYGAPAPSSYGTPGPSGSTGFLAGTGMDKDFPDGQLSCSQFPDQYGAIDLEWLGLGGWSGIQKGSMMAGGYGNIETVVASQCNGKDCCTEGAYCSYACPAGYQKSQWPQTQGNTGQSVGGIQCQGGKLHLTNKQMSSKLCIPGSTEVPIKVQNKMGENVAICRTDYPGTESETVPLDAQPGTTQNMTCPQQDKYYSWLGKPTSAQYYVNPKGKSVKEACQWSTPGSNMGNFAPLNIGLGYSGGRAWLSVFQNAPTTNTKLQYSVEIVGDSNNLSGKCRYKDGQYCSGDNYQDCSPTKGCTVSVGSGTATFVLSD